MARAHFEAPKAEQPKPLMPFDVGDIETPAEKPVKRAKKGPPRIPAPKVRSAGPAMESLPGVHAKKRSKRPVKSEGTSTEVSEALDSLRAIASEKNAEKAAAAPQMEAEAAAKAEEAEWEAKIAEVKGNMERKERAEKQGARVELAAAAMEASEAYEKAKSNLKRVEDRVSSRVKEIDAELEAKGYTGEKLLIAREEMFNRGMLNEQLDEAIDDLTQARSDYESAYSSWEKTIEPSQVKEIKASVSKDESEEEITDEMIVQEKPLEHEEKADFTEQESSWFKQGEEIGSEASQIAAARAEIESGGRGAELTDEPADIAGSIKEAEALVRNGEFSKGDVADYTYLLNERARIDKELETAGWWKARSLRKDLAKIQKGGYDSSGTQGLEYYEHKIDVAKSAAAPRPTKKAEEPPRKLKFWESLKMTKGR